MNDANGLDEQFGERVAAALVRTLNRPDVRPLRAVAWRWDAASGRPAGTTTAWPPPRPRAGAATRHPAGGALLLETGVERRGADLELTFHLFDAVSGALAWTRRYVHAATESAAVPDEAAHAVAGALRELVTLPATTFSP